MKKILGFMQFGNVGIAAAFCLTLTSSLAQEAEIKNAERLIEQDKKKQAVEVLKKALTDFPNATQLHYYLGHSQLVAGDTSAAKKSFEMGLEANPKEALNYAGLGHIMVLEKKIDQAKPLFERAYKYGKKDVASLQAIAEAEINNKALRKNALEMLNRAKEMEPTNAKTYMLIGDYHLSENNGGATASAHEDAAAVNPGIAAPWYKHALLFKRSRNIDIVEQDLKKAIKIDPEFALAHKELGELYYLKKDGENAAKHYKIYLDLTDSPAKDDRFKYAFFLFMAKDYGSANKEFKRLSEQPDVTSTTLKFYAQSLLQEGDLAASQKVFEQYMKNPETKLEADDYSNYAVLLQKQDKDSLAAIAFHQSLALDKDQPDIVQTLIDYYFNKVRKFKECSAICREAIKIRKKPYANDYYTLGRSLYLEKKYPQADSAFAKLIELKPDITLGYNWAARSKSQQDSLLTDGLAKPFYEKVIEIGEKDKDNNKSELIAAYQYMGSFNMIKQDNKIAKEYWEKVLALDPEDTNAKEALKYINASTQAAPKRRR